MGSVRARRNREGRSRPGRVLSFQVKGKDDDVAVPLVRAYPILWMRLWLNGLETMEQVQ